MVQKVLKEGRAETKALKIRLAFDPLKLVCCVRSGDLIKIKHRGVMLQDVLAGGLKICLQNKH